MEIVAIVKFNDSVGLVFDKIDPLEYEKIGDSIIGSNGLFCACYYYEAPSYAFKAFGGREFDITLKDGTVIHCNGQWWDGITSVHRQIVPDIVYVTASSIDELKKCYVFFGYSSSKKKINEMISAYTGRIWDYREYEATITSNIYRVRAWHKNRDKESIDFREKKNWRRYGKKVLVGENPLLKLQLP